MNRPKPLCDLIEGKDLFILLTILLAVGATCQIGKNLLFPPPRFVA